VVAARWKQNWSGHAHPLGLNWNRRISDNDQGHGDSCGVGEELEIICPPRLGKNDGRQLSKRASAAWRSTLRLVVVLPS